MYCVKFFVFSMLVGVVLGCRGSRQMIKSGGLSDEEKQGIVDAHNRLRQSVALGQITSQPPAANMMEMKWDDELAARAQSWADNCITAHDDHHSRDVGRFQVGQNLAATWTTRRPSAPKDTVPDFQKQIQAWFDEVRAYGYKPTTGSHGTGHYSQLVWSESSLVGCGFSFYYDQTRGYVKLYVCNYGPSGNVLGLKPYEKGLPACNNYGLSDSQKYNGLCDIYGNSIDENFGQVQINSIPESSPDAVDTTSFDAFNYKAFGDLVSNNNPAYPWQISSNNNYYYQQHQQQQQQQQNKQTVNYYQQVTEEKKPAVNYYQQATEEKKPENYYEQQTETKNVEYQPSEAIKPASVDIIQAFNQFTTPKPVTFKPFASLLNDAASSFETAAKKVIHNVVHTKRGFRFGTLFL